MLSNFWRKYSCEWIISSSLSAVYQQFIYYCLSLKPVYWVHTTSLTQDNEDKHTHTKQLSTGNMSQSTMYISQSEKNECFLSTVYSTQEQIFTYISKQYTWEVRFYHSISSAFPARATTNLCLLLEKKTNLWIFYPRACNYLDHRTTLA